LAQTSRNPNIPDVFYDMALVAVETVDEAEHTYKVHCGNYCEPTVEYHTIENLETLINKVALEMYKAFLLGVKQR